MTNPIILLTPQYNEERNIITFKSRYADQMARRGAIPLLAPVTDSDGRLKKLCETADGFIFTGGDDVDPILYGQQVSPDCGRITRYRDDYEIALLHEAMKTGKPILGICRGIQLINVALGGTLIQHIDNHRGVTHDVDIAEGTKLADISGETHILTNSYHHQAVDKLGDSLTVTGHAEDGTIEAIESTDYPFLVAVQWHPEVTENNEADIWAGRLLDAFVAECSK